MRFRNPGVEHTFLRETLERSLNFVRVYLIAGIGLYLCFGVLDLIVGSDSLLALWAHPLRHGVPDPARHFVLTFFPVFIRYAQPALMRRCSPRASASS